MHEDLIGYLLGALEPEEMQRVTEALRQDPKLRAELERLRLTLKPLDEIDDIFEPPGDLLGRTMANLPPLGETADKVPVGQESDADAFGSAGPNFAGPTPANSDRQRNYAAPVDASDVHWRLADILGMCAAVAVLAGLVLPSILRQRAAARVVACQTQLRDAGTALVEYLMRSDDGRFPALDEDGPLSFSGRYAVTLADAGLISRAHPMWCPSLDVPEDWGDSPIPTRQQVLNAQPIMLTKYQRSAGGHYAYSLGIFERGHYTAPRFQGRSGFAILADAPLQSLDGWTTGHEGKGFNILFEDGHIRFVAETSMGELGDHPFLNRSGEIEAGLDPDDASLAPSQVPPFLPIRYRR